ncbi:CidA/LrgA family protein [Metabacillus sp. GX 13764]|uniref:CidA/LrgA family protein n=1 Tax=Metabacillus kandeliae TaxID=2900151 RepID=UPI001E4A1314|nr:CidA/LrgA family protein [Metabacillus kandeliae]MCD7032706.1 CidA/LrgA family protein [Metabacillus kandeliae]
MRAIKIAGQILLLFSFSLGGTFLQQLLHLPLPGSIIGMVLLFFLLKLRVLKPSWLKEGSGFLLKHLTLLFIPATAGVVQYLNLFQGKGLISLAIVLASSVLVFLSSVIVYSLLSARSLLKDTSGKKEAEL